MCFKMTDKKWLKVIEECSDVYAKYLALLEIAEEEYIRRYGNNPSDVDDDWWIDCMHYGVGAIDLDKIKQSASRCDLKR